MNKYKEALNELSYPLEDSSCGGCKCGESDCQDCKKALAVFTLQELVEKATPKKLNRFYFDNQGYRSFACRCPICDKHFGLEFSIKEKPNYCSNCGQVLYWGDDK